MMIAGGYMVDSKKGNPALDFAAELAIDDLDAALLKDSKAQATTAKIKEPAIGSYERIMSAFGGKLAPPKEG